MTGGAVARRWACLAAAVALAAASIPWIGAGQAAAAPTLTVNSTADVVDLVPGDGICDTGNLVGLDPECTLRAAIQEANLGPADEIVLPGGTYTLTIAGTGEDVAATGDLDITADLTITGADLATTIVQAGTDATNGIDRVFETHTGVTATLSDLTIRFGKLDLSVEGGAIMNVGTLTIVDAVISDSIGKRGGGVYSQGVAADLTLTRVTLRDNSATDGGGAASKEGVATFTDVVFDGNTAFRKGGGLETEKGATTITGASFVGNSAGSEDGGGAHLRDGTHTLTDVTFDNNTAARRGGGLNNDGAITTITGGTFSSNVAMSEDGGGVNNRGGGANLTLTNVTISGNSAGRDGGGVNAAEDIAIYSSTITLNSAGVDGDGIHRSGKTFSIKNSIVAGNVGGGNCHGTITSLGYNLEDTAVCPFTQPGDLLNADPLLGPLTDNGGPTLTHALSTGSPAMEAGTSLGVGVPGVDQRGVGRPQDGDNDTFAIIDIGAYEHQFAVPNNPPTDISLVPGDVDENVPVGTVVGTLITTDPDPADTHT
ncbi:MAG: CSLREA domain-containing protein, partial [Acidimicrobiia bacterium]|nr:CSLREA domain-containing protein [Acidimicrobiia bacterium]